MIFPDQSPVSGTAASETASRPSGVAWMGEIFLFHTAKANADQFNGVLYVSSVDAEPGSRPARRHAGPTFEYVSRTTATAGKPAIAAHAARE